MTPRSRPPGQQNNVLAFTLIELLVVIAILAAMLLPTLSKAKNCVQGISCLNNLKPMGWALVMYATDNQEPLAQNGAGLTQPTINMIRTQPRT